ncbi:MAG: hypothetical protein HY394_00520 [Candidatus Diapherotrites archaeon]|nr:hypothetical protein [Candidatus Diapherotrites archaeon]
MKKTRTIFIPLILFAALVFAGCTQANEKTGLLTLSANERVNILDGDRYWSLGAGKADGITGQPLQDTSTIYPGSFSIRDLWVQKDRLFIDRTGRIGIGTTAPEVKLDIKESDQTYPPLRITNTKNDGYAGIVFGTDSGIQGHMGAAGYYAANQKLRNSVYFGSTGDKRVVITANGIPRMFIEPTYFQSFITNSPDANGSTSFSASTTMTAGNQGRGIYFRVMDIQGTRTALSVSLDAGGSTGVFSVNAQKLETSGGTSFTAPQTALSVTPETIRLTLLNGARIKIASSAPANRQLCITGQQELGFCSSVNADGTCTCVPV